MSKKEQWTAIIEAVKAVWTWLYDIKEIIENTLEHPYFKVFAIAGMLVAGAGIIGRIIKRQL